MYYCIGNIPYGIFINDYDEKDIDIQQTFILKWPDECDIIIRYQIPHFIIKYTEIIYSSYFNFFEIIIDENIAPFAVLCGLDIVKYNWDNIVEHHVTDEKMF